MERSEGRTTRIVQHNGRGQLRDTEDVPIGELLRRISGDASLLVQQLGDAIDSYWASALIVGVVLVLAAAALARRGTSAVKDGRLSMDDTTQSLREDARWGKEELRAFKRELTA
jgi:hypothetical protein